VIGARSVLGRVTQYVLAIGVFVFFAFPVYWIVTLSLKATEDTWGSNPKWFVFTPTLVQYRDLFAGMNFLMYYRNSLIIVVGALAISLLFGVPLGYALARFPWKKKKDISFFVLSQLMLPPAAVALSFYLLISQLGLLRTLFGPMIVYVVFTMPFIAWMMKGFFEALPIELEEAALVDGCTRFEAFRRIVLPLVTGSLTSTTKLAAITALN
jgi:multiple sugar transport system permease protein